MIAKSAVFAALLALLMPSLAVAQNSGNPSGTWLTQAGDARVKVSKCGSGICGNVVWLRESIDRATGRPAVDDKNPDPARANRPMIGLQIFAGMRPAGPSQWTGQIYNSDDGKTYASTIAMTGPNTLRVEGCVGALCGSETWTRAGR